VDGKEAPVREMSRTRGTSSREQQQVTAAMLDGSGGGVGIYGSRQQQAPAVNQNLQNVDTGRDLQHKLIGFYNRDEKCLQRSTDWVFK